MTVADVTPSISYSGNGATTTFATGFKFLQSNDLRVRQTISGVTTTLTEGVQYTVTGANSDAGGNVVFGTAPANGTLINIRRFSDATQDVDFANVGRFSPSIHQAAIDKGVMLQQEAELALEDAVTELSDTIGASGSGGFSDQYLELTTNPSAAVSGATKGRARFNAATGAFEFSEGGSVYLSARHRGHFDIRDFGATPDDTGSSAMTSNVAAFAAACAAAASSGTGHTATGYVWLPPGDFYFNATIGHSGLPGFLIKGAGRRTSILRWKGASGIPFLQIKNSQHWSLESFGMEGDAAHPPSSMVNSHFVSGDPGYIMTAMTMRDLFIGYTGTASQFTRGIVFDGSDANNSESLIDGCTVQGFIQAGISFENSQSRAHVMTGCQLNGNNVGLYGVASFYGTATQGGDYVFRDGGISAVAGACFRTGANNSRIVIDNVTSEACRRFFVMYDADAIAQGSAPAGTVNFPVFIRNCLWSADQSAPDGFAVTYDAAGPFIFEGNNFGAGGTAGGTPPAPQILLVDAGTQSGVVIRNNLWNATNSSSQECYFLSTSTGVKTHPLCEENVYTDGTGNIVRRADGILGPNANWNVLEPTRVRRQQIRLEIPKSKFITNGTSQTVALPTLPPHTQLNRVYLFIYDHLVGAGATTAKLGTTAGGNELIVAATVSSTDQDTIGDASGELGATLSGAVQFGTSPKLTFTDTGTTLYLTLTSTTNLGNGTVTNLTSGRIQVLLDVEVWAGNPY